MNSQYPVISFIATFYSISEYVERCVGSLLSQTIREQCEFILVDDGSIDGTSALLDAYSQEDGVHIIHQQNQGISVARNAGVGIARGRYVAFVDGDDFVSPRYAETLLRAIDDRDDRIAVVDLSTVPLSAVGTFRFDEPGSTEVVSSDDALERLCYRRGIGESAHCKLFPIRVMRDNPFPPHRKYEDLATIGAFLSAVCDVAIVQGRLYAYVERPMSISRGKVYSPQDVDDYEFALAQLERTVAEHLPDFRKAWRYKRLLTCARMRPVIQGVAESDRGGAVRNARLANARYLRRNSIPALLDRRAPLANRLRFVLLAFFPAIYDRVFAAWKRRSA